MGPTVKLTFVGSGFFLSQKDADCTLSLYIYYFSLVLVGVMREGDEMGRDIEWPGLDLTSCIYTDILARRACKDELQMEETRCAWTLYLSFLTFLKFTEAACTVGFCYCSELDWPLGPVFFRSMD